MHSMLVWDSSKNRLPTSCCADMGDCKTGVRDQIIQSLTGTKVIIRDLNAQLEGWPHDISPHLDRLREDVDHHLNK